MNLTIGVEEMFGFFRKTQPGKLYLGNILLIPREDWEKVDEISWFGLKRVDLESHVKNRITDVFSLPETPDPELLSPNDLALEIAILKIQGGYLSGSGTSFPVFWRPKIKLNARLYHPLSLKTKKVITIESKASWKEFAYKTIDIKTLIDYSPAFDEKDMDYLIARACKALLEKISKAV